MDGIDKAADSFARALMSVNEYRERMEAMRFRYVAKRIGDPGSYFLGHYSEYMSLEDQLYFVLAMTIRVFDRIEPAAAETHGNATSLLATLGRLRGP
ncbi:hypothetical protein PG996_004916 [Apiospora saccharicola]|uniref:Uncharacterized protein n=1 Tax=Apiospora saccharicola TaxID=335842 RepID=A0ABR1VP05_9PEZI